MWDASSSPAGRATPCRGVWHLCGMNTTDEMVCHVSAVVNDLVALPFENDSNAQPSLCNSMAGKKHAFVPHCGKCCE
jgi:hypothetical protein